MRVNEEHVTHPDQAFRLLNLELPLFAGERHRHPQLELTWVERGRGVRLVGDSAEPFEDGDLVLLGEKLPHLWTSLRGGDAPQPSRATVLQFPGSLVDTPGMPELQALRPLLQRAARGLAVAGQTHAAVVARLPALHGAGALGRLLGLIELLRVLSLRPADLRPLASRPAAADSSGRGARIDRVIDWIQAHLAEPLSLEDAARQAHVTPAAFSRFFKRETGKTFTDYVNDLRCSEACVRLRSTADPVGAVALACGFSTASHFNRQFSTRLAMTPRAYRKG